MKQLNLNTSPGATKAPKYLSDLPTSESDSELIDLSANESALGPSPKALQAYQDASQAIWRYPDGTGAALKTKIANKYSLDPERIVLGCGSDELITLLTRIFATPKQEVLHVEYGFIMYAINAIRIGATPVAAKSVNYTVQVDDILNAITDNTAIIFVANPNNPTGTTLSREQIIHLAQQVPEHIPLVLDSAYAEYMDDSMYTDGLDLVDAHPNIIVLRTFSKIFGLAGLRIGWSYSSSQISDLLERARGPYNISLPALKAACVAIDDDEHLHTIREHNRHWLKVLVPFIRQQGFQVGEVAGNFILISFKDEHEAKRVFQFLLDNKVLLRPLNGYGLSHCLRLTIGVAEQNEQFMTVLSKYQHTSASNIEKS